MTTTGRSSTVSPELHSDYWLKQTEEERQKILRDLYEKRNAIDPYATSRDYNQRELEITALKNALKDEQPDKLIDFGCGNGYTLLSIAKEIPGWKFEGVDFSQVLIDGANQLKVNEKLQSEVTFHCGDAIGHIKNMADASVRGVITERFLLNLPSKEAQRDYLKQIHRVLAKNGIFLMCEGSMEGFRGLNALRISVGLEPTAETSTDNLSAIRFEDREVEDFVVSLGFKLERKEGFSAFFAMSRALHPALIAPESPKFDAKINDLARALQMQMPFSPGVGSNVLWTLRKN